MVLTVVDENDQKRLRQTWLEADDVVRVIAYCHLFFPHEMDAVDCHCYLYDRKNAVVLPTPSLPPMRCGQPAEHSGHKILRPGDDYYWCSGKGNFEEPDLRFGPSSTHNLIDDHGTDPRLHHPGGGSRARRIGMGLGRILGRMAHWMLAPTGEWGKPKKGDW